MRGPLALLLWCATARADTLIELGNTKARLELPEKWQKVASDLLAVYKHPAGSLLVIVRSDAPNGDAWADEKDKNLAYAEAIERGFKAATPGYKRIARKLTKANGVPALDLESTRKDSATVITRVLLFKSYSLALSIEVPKLGDLAVARSIASKFAPPRSPD